MTQEWSTTATEVSHLLLFLLHYFSSTFSSYGKYWPTFPVFGFVYSFWVSSSMPSVTACWKVSWVLSSRGSRTPFIMNVCCSSSKVEVTCNKVACHDYNENNSLFIIFKNLSLMWLWPLSNQIMGYILFFVLDIWERSQQSSCFPCYLLEKEVTRLLISLVCWRERSLECLLLLLFIGERSN